MIDEKPFPWGRALRIVGVLGWTLLWLLIWGWYMIALSKSTGEASAADANTAAVTQICGCLLASGCCGGFWIVYSLLRR